MDAELILKTVHGLIDGEKAKREKFEAQVEALLKETTTGLLRQREEGGRLQFLFDALSEYLQERGVIVPDDWAKYLKDRINEANKAAEQMMANLERFKSLKERVGVGAEMDEVAQ